jgi:ATP-dependent Clp protease protease subunit
MNTIVLQETEHGDQAIDVYQKLANDRILFITDFITNDLATDICATLLLKDFEDSDKKITLFINCEGGEMRSTFMIYDTMKLISAPVETVCIGAAMDEAAIILAGGTPGLRFATKNATIAVSQLVQNWNTHTNMTDGKNLMDQFIVDNNRFMEILGKASNKNVKQVKIDFDRKVFFSAPQALKYGLIDKVISK